MGAPNEYIKGNNETVQAMKWCGPVQNEVQICGDLFDFYAWGFDCWVEGKRLSSDAFVVEPGQFVVKSREGVFSLYPEDIVGEWYMTTTEPDGWFSERTFDLLNAKHSESARKMMESKLTPSKPEQDS